MRLRPAIPTLLLPQARAAFKANDWVTFFGKADSNWSLWLLGMNHQAIRNKGEYERALLVAWVNQKVTRVILNGEPLNWTPFMKRYLASCDRSKLLQASDPLPEGDPLTVYRGHRSGERVCGRIYGPQDNGAPLHGLRIRQREWTHRTGSDVGASRRLPGSGNQNV
jgi:hypothetical protein